MKILRLIALAFSAALCGAAFCVPKALIVQYSVDSKDSDSPLNLADNLARALEDTGKLDTIVWSMSDPIFRAAVLDGKLGTVPDQPSLDQALDAAKTLHCDYTMSLQASLKGTTVSGKLEVFRGGRSVWSDSEQMDPGRASVTDLDNTLRSIARTWSFKLSQGLLKDIQSQPKPPETPAPSAGQIPPASGQQAPPKPEPPEDSSRLLAEYQAKIAAGKTSEGLILLREAIDAHPLDAPLRKAYIQHLQRAGRAAEAAAEARRATDLIPDDQELRALAAKAFLSSGKGDQALAELNEALARNPEDPVARSMAADLAMEGQRFAEAISHLDVVIRVAPSAPLLYRRAMVYGVLGNVPASVSDLAKAAQVKSGAAPENWDEFCTSVMDDALDRTAGDLRSLAQRLAVRREDPDAQGELDSQMVLLKARSDFMAGWPTSDLHRKSSRRRNLALSLLAQSLSEFKAFVANGSEDTLTDANIDLGEAIKQLKSAREALTAEGKRTKDGSTTVHLVN